MSVNITWLGHSCFVIECESYRVVIDPYKDDKVPGLGPVRTTAHEVICSHGHEDHSWAQAITLVTATAPSPFVVSHLDTYHDDAQGSLRGMNRITVFDAQGLRIAHFGDLGAWPTAQQLEMLNGVDVALVPVGGYYTIDGEIAAELADVIAARVVIPMHYRSATFGFELIDTIDPFLAMRSNVIRYETNSIVVDQETPPQTAVLTYTSGR